MPCLGLFVQYDPPDDPKVSASKLCKRNYAFLNFAKFDIGI